MAAAWRGSVVFWGGVDLKDPLQLEKTPFELLGVTPQATEAEIMAGFKKAILTNRDVNALNKARLSLQRPLERALLGLFMYRPEGLQRVSASPAMTIQSLSKMPHLRETLAQQWEAALLPVYPEIDLIHALAVLYWWDAQRGLEVQKWAGAIGYWVTLVFHPNLGRLLPGVDASVLSGVADAVIDRLRTAIERNGRLQDGLHPNAVASLDNLEREARAAQALRALNLPVNGVALSGGPLALTRAGILENLRGRLDALYQRNRSEPLQKVRSLFSHGALIELLIERADFEQAQKRLDQMKPSPAVDELRSRVARGRARQQLDVGNVDGALVHWKVALERTPPGSARADLVAEVSQGVRGAVERLDDDDIDRRIDLLGKAFAITSDADVRAILGEAHMQRAFKVLPGNDDDLSQAGLRKNGESLLRRQRDALDDFERASALGVARVAGFLQKIRANLTALEEMVRDAKAQARPQQLSLFDEEDDSDESDDDDDDESAWLMHEWEAQLPSIGFAVSFSQSGALLAVGHGEGTTIFDVESGERLRGLSDDGHVQAVLFSPFSDDYLFEGSDTGHVGIWTLGESAGYRNLDYDDEQVVGLALSADWRSLAIVREDVDSLRVRSVVDDDVHDVDIYSEDDVTAVAALHSSRTWVIGAGTSVALCPVDDVIVLETTGIETYVKSLAVSSDDRLVAAGGLLGDIAIVDARSLRVLRKIEAHDIGVSSVAFSPDGALLMSGSNSGEVKLFSVQTGDELDCESHDEWVRGVAFSPDGEYAASVSFDKTVKVWRIER